MKLLMLGIEKRCLKHSDSNRVMILMQGAVIHDLGGLGAIEHRLVNAAMGGK